MIPTSSARAPVRGLRNCNPGNLRHTGAFTWQGEIAPDAQGYCRFDSARDGMRALAHDLLAKWRRGLDTVRRIIEVYAPPSENPTQNYIANVAAALGVKPDARLDLEAPGTLTVLVKAVIRQECGAVPFLIADIAAAVQDALASPHPAHAARAAALAAREEEPVHG